MDAKKTGALIAQARHDLNLTQKELASRLSVSDRAVSKWERGAGFPDVSLLEPLAAELGLTAAELLRGERTTGTENTAEIIRDAVRLGRKQLWAALRRNFAGIVILLLLFWIFATATRLPDRLLTRTEEIDRTVTAGIYTAEGERIGETEVEIIGEASRRIGTEEWWYYGRFAVAHIPQTQPEGVWFGIAQQVDDHGYKYTQKITRYRAGLIDFDVFKYSCYAAPSLQAFALMTQEGQIIATDDYLAELMALYPTMYHLDNWGMSVFAD